MSERDDLYQQFEKLGEDLVRDRLAQAVYNERRTKLAKAWLEIKENNRDAQASRESLRIANSAKNAAWAAAIAAIIAIPIAVAAIVISWLSLQSQ